MKKFLLTAIAVLVFVLFSLFVYRYISIEKIPPETHLVPMQQASEVNLAVPFFSQAPLKDWGLPFQEACEETSALLVDAYYKSKTYTPEEAQQAILDLVAWEQEHFGFYKHTTAEDTAKLLREYFGYKDVEVRYDFSLEDLKNELRAGKPVIVPLAGRHVGNPHYTHGGPVYHMLVVKGFTADGRIITNDVGTQFGHNYTFPEQKFFESIHDASSSGDGTITDEEILKGRKAMIVAYGSFS